MTPTVDAGPCVAWVPVQIDPEETAGELEVRLAEVGARLVRQTLELFDTGREHTLPLPRLWAQNPDLASRAPRLKKSDGLIDWQRPAIAIKNQIRAFEPWPKSYTYWHHGYHDGPALRLILGPVQVLGGPSGDPAAPGTVLQASGDCLTVTTGEGVIAIQNAQPAGKRLLRVEEFLRGYRVRPGDRFGPQ
jgi:methionyl-tRNA formyltransferase